VAEEAMSVNRRHDDDGPILITQAAPSYDEEFAARKKRYSLIMACRIPCLLLAGVFGIGFNLPLVAVLFIVLSVPLPWVAVLIANDRPPRKAEKANKFKRSAHEVEAVSDRQIIEAAEVLDARDRRDDGSHQDRSEPAPPTMPRTGTDG
jgi:hypothetical protein